MRTRSVIASGAALIAVGIAGCGSSPSNPAAGAVTTANPNAPEVSPSGDIPDTQAFVAYSPPGSFYSVKVPEGWARTTSGGAVSFTDKLNSIRMQAMPAQREPTTAAAKNTEVPMLAKMVPGFRLGNVSMVNRRAGPAVLITYSARSGADPVTGKSRINAVERYAFFHSGQDLILTLTAPQGADNVDPWKTVTDSLHYTR